jgi:Cof subfamily protein (haloacid dehalogenase superfamily)
MSNKYSQWLLVSDIDGTLNNKKRKLPHKNKVDIQRFVENGGNFTLCSGRNLKSLSSHYLNLGISTPAICMNGAGIYDFSNGKTLYYSTITPEGEKAVVDILKKFKFVQLTVFDMNTLYRYKRGCVYGLFVSCLDKIPRVLCKKETDLPTGNWGKVTLFSFPFICKKIEKYIKNSELNNLFECVYTSPITLELLNKGVNKGTGVEKLAEIMGISPENIAAIGDYYNDEAMLKSVSHPACCGQAPDDLKSLCEYVTCHCNDGAVSDFINYLERNYIL